MTDPANVPDKLVAESEGQFGLAQAYASISREAKRELCKGRRGTLWPCAPQPVRERVWLKELLVRAGL
jgi:hypothetical protein